MRELVPVIGAISLSEAFVWVILVVLLAVVGLPIRRVLLKRLENPRGRRG